MTACASSLASYSHDERMDRQLSRSPGWNLHGPHTTSMSPPSRPTEVVLRPQCRERSIQGGSFMKRLDGLAGARPGPPGASGSGTCWSPRPGPRAPILTGLDRPGGRRLVRLVRLSPQAGSGPAAPRWLRGRRPSGDRGDWPGRGGVARRSGQLRAGWLDWQSLGQPGGKPVVSTKLGARPPDPAPVLIHYVDQSLEIFVVRNDLTVWHIRQLQPGGPGRAGPRWASRVGRAPGPWDRWSQRSMPTAPWSCSPPTAGTRFSTAPSCGRRRRLVRLGTAGQPGWPHGQSGAGRGPRTPDIELAGWVIEAG